jgi:ATP-dependent helicase/nuclease subunit A
MKEVQWTREQRQAIEGRGGSILVSAAAGSGKTAVLVERVIGMLTRQEDPVDADELLVVTFSNAAAREMKQRISRRLWELARDNPGDQRLARQQLLLESAQISTIHAFCISLIRSYFQRLGIPAEFRIAEERELDVLRMRTVRQVIEEAYAAGEESFFDLVELLSTARSDGSLERNILKLYEFVRNHPFYEEWMEQVLAEYDVRKPLEETPWAGILMEYAGEGVDYCRRLTSETIALIRGDAEMEKAYLAPFLLDAAALDACREALDSGSWDRCCQIFSMTSFGKLGPLSSKYRDPEKKRLVQENRKVVKDLITRLKTRCFLMESDGYRRDMEHQEPVIRKLFHLTRRFGEELGKAKLERNLLDFGDLEHYALALLYDEDGHGGHIPSSVAAEVAARYREVLVDEYQDTNAAQEMIFAAVSRNGENLFMVGDVKQSIYRFRQARPEIFLRKKESYTNYDGLTFPAKIALNANFRTRRETTGLINDFFQAAMCPTVGEMYYREEDALISAASFDYTISRPVTLAVVDPEEPGVEAASLEAEYIAGEVETLLSGDFTVEDKGRRRPLAPGDICILLRSPKNKAERYTQALEGKNIRCWAERQGGFLESREIAPVTAFLKLIANPLLDLELAQVLLSPMYGCTADEIANLRTICNGKKLYTYFSLETGPLPGALEDFRRDYRRMRGLASSLSVQELLMELYAATGLPDKVRVMPQGETRAANLRLLLDYAGDYQSRGGDFGDFVSYLASLQELDSDLPAAAPPAGDAVSIMSIHKSKGLEFPVVFLADISAPFNLRDLSDEVLLNPELGAACTLRDNRRMQEHETVARAAMGEKNRQALLSEELRLLYVAMTRAREKLYLVGADPGLKRLRSAAGHSLGEGRVQPWLMRSGRCFFDWLAEVLVHHPGFGKSEMKIGPGKSEEICKWQGELEVRWVRSAKEATEDSETRKILEGAVDGEALSRLRRAVSYSYPYPQDVNTPSKLSVSELTHAAPGEDVYLFRRRPKCLVGEAMTPTERGIAAHKFMQFADFAAAVQDPEKEIARLRDRGFITSEESEQMDRRMVTDFFRSPIGRRVLSAEKVYREIRFLKEFSPEELEKAAPGLGIGGSTVIQGVADCVILEHGRGTIVDYKTDRVQRVEELAERYGTQLNLYRAILEEYLGIPIEEKILYSFALGEAVTVP